MHNLVLIIAIAMILWLALKQKPKGARRSPCPPLGDCDGDGWVTKEDIKLLQRWIMVRPPTADMLARADVNGDGMLTLTDFGYMKLYIAGQIDTFPACNL